jgi:hypothetical protein
MQAGWVLFLPVVALTFSRPADGGRVVAPVEHPGRSGVYPFWGLLMPALNKM